VQRLIVDMDGVLADIYAQYLIFEESESGIRRTLESLNSKSESVVFKDIIRYLHTPGFFRNAPVIEDSIEALHILNKNYELFVVSSATEFPHSFNEKYDWLTEHFPFLTWKQMVFCGSKSIVQGDIMIDDHFKNLDYFTVFTHPWQRNQWPVCVLIPG